LLPAAPDWRWLLDRNDSPWYAGHRLYRQSRPGDWAPAIAAIARDLAQSHPAAVATSPARPACVGGERSASMQVAATS
ncbi:MAG: hypothetical protein KGK10_04690, partial [Rhodospirillales bacterium]|nr:hypothetical protein [Rhodospirillales bacterium]